MKARFCKLLPEAGLAVAALLTHFLLRHYLLQANVVAKLLAAGPQVDRRQLILALFFVLLRFSVIGILPGYIITRALFYLRAPAGQLSSTDR